MFMLEYFNFLHICNIDFSIKVMVLIKRNKLKYKFMKDISLLLEIILSIAWKVNAQVESVCERLHMNVAQTYMRFDIKNEDKGKNAEDCTLNDPSRVLNSQTTKLTSVFEQEMLFLCSLVVWTVTKCISTIFIYQHFPCAPYQKYSSGDKICKLKKLNLEKICIFFLWLKFPIIKS